MKKTLAQLKIEMAAKRAEAEARHKKLTAHNAKKANKPEDRAQIKAWVKAISTGDKKGLKEISEAVKAEYKSLNVSTPAEGGYLVPTVVEGNILEILKDISPLRSVFTVIPNAPSKLTLNAQATRPTVGWTAEEAKYHQTGITWTPETITAHKITGIVPITEEFMEDVANYAGVQALLERQLAEEIAYQENIAFISGDGVTRPLGFRTIAGDLPTSQVVDVADFGALDFTEVKALKRALKRYNRRSAVFIGNEDVVTTLDAIKDGNGKYVLNENLTEENDVTRLLGRPYVEADELTQEELWFVNGARYVITDVTGIRIDFGYATDDFEEGRESLRVMKRVGGSPIGVDGFAVAKEVA